MDTPSSHDCKKNRTELIKNIPRKEKRKQKKEKKNNNKTMCVICYDKPSYKNKNSEVQFNGLHCPNEHHVCFTCLRGLIKPHTCSEPDCHAPIQWQCPFRCSEPVVGGLSQIMAIGMGSWKITDMCEQLFED